MSNSNTSSGFNDDLNDLICHGPDRRPRTFVQRYWTFFEQHLCGRIIRKVMPISSEKGNSISHIGFQLPSL